MLAWQASGYGALAEELLARGEAAGLAVGALSVPPREDLAMKEGACAVNGHAEALGFEVVGWGAVRHGCSDSVERKQHEL